VPIGGRNGSAGDHQLIENQQGDHFHPKGNPLATLAPTAAPKPKKRAATTPAAAPEPAPVPAVEPTPIATALIGAVNRSSGDSGVGTISAANKARAQRAGTAPSDLVFSVDNSRKRTSSSIIDGSGL